MALQVLNLILQATDKASRTIAGVIGKMTGLSAAAGAASRSGGLTGDAIAFSMVKANLAVSAITSGVSQLEQKLSEASQIQLENLSAAAGLAVYMKGDFDKAAESVDRMNVALAKVAGPLPGATGDYVQMARLVSDNVAEIYSDVNNILTNPKGFEDMTKSIATSYTAMAKSGMSGMSGAAGQANMNILLQKLMLGRSKSEMMMIESFARNPTLQGAYDRVLKAKGVKDLKDLGSKEKVIQAVDEIGKQVVTPEFLGRASKTAQATIDGFMSNLFDPYSGVFGLWRDLDGNADNGTQAAFQSYEKFLQLLIGPTGFADEVGKLAEALGLSADPMKLLRDGFEWMASFTKKLTDTLKRFREGIAKTTPESAFKMLQGALGGLGGFFAEQFNRFVRWLDQQVDDFDPASIPTEQLSGAILGFIGGIADFFNQLDKKELADLGASIIFKLIETIGYVMTHLDPQVYAVMAGAILVRVLPALLAAKFGAMALRLVTLTIIPTILKSALVLMATVVPALAGIGARIAAMIAVATGGLPLAIVGSLVLAFGLVAWSLYRTITTRWDDVVSHFGRLFDKIKTVMSNTWDLAVGIVTLNGPLIFSSLTKLFSGVKQVFDDLANKWSVLTTGKSIAENQVIEQDLAMRQQQAARGNRFETGPDGITRFPAGTAKYMGHIPTAFGGLLSALNSETRNMPRGAGLAIANTSEAILRPEQLKNLVFGSVSAGAAQGNMTFAPNITVSGSSDPRQTAEMVMQAMEQMFGEFTRGQLA
jgi:hypothetical protein